MTLVIERELNYMYQIQLILQCHTHELSIRVYVNYDKQQPIANHYLKYITTFYFHNRLHAVCRGVPSKIFTNISAI